VIRQRFLAAAFLCCSVAPTGFAAASEAQPGGEDRTVTSERRDRPPSALWDEFPLGKPTRAREPATPRSDRVSQDREPAAFESRGEELSSAELMQLLLLFAGLTALVLLGPAVFILVRTPKPVDLDVAAEAPPTLQPQRRPATATTRHGSAYVAEQRTRLLAAMRGPGTTQERLHAARAVVIEALQRDMVSSENAEGRQEPVEPDVTQLGDRVAAVLRAAEEAAEQIRTDAQAASERVTRQAEHEAKARLEESRREAVRVLSDAEAQARASREAAEAMVQRIQESARSLEEEVREQERMIRGRMQRYLAGLRDASGQIEAVLRETERDAPPLVEALNVERANHKL
jgi:cell division septum initiation protein DivIVA